MKKCVLSVAKKSLEFAVYSENIQIKVVLSYASITMYILVRIFCDFVVGLVLVGVQHMEP